MTQPHPDAPHTPEASAIPHDRALELRTAAAFVGALAALGALLGLVWAWWSPAGPAACVLGDGAFQPDDTEAFVAGDGRFLVIAASVGLVAAVGAWWRVPARGARLALALTLGGLLGALLMELVGHLAGGGSFDGTRIPGSSCPNELVTRNLPLSLHLQGLLFVEPAVAVLVFGVLAAFTVRDDLGRADPDRDELWRAREAAASVGPGHHPQDGGGDGDAVGLLQQRDLPPQ